MLAFIQRRPVQAAISSWISLAAAVGLSLALGCDRNLEAFDPNEKPREPDLARIFPAVQEGPGLRAAPTVGRGESPTGAAGAGSLAPAASSGTTAQIRGRIEIAPEFAEDVRPEMVLFLIARSGAAAGGPPLAVRRFTSPRFPLEFEIGQENVMMPNMRFEGAIQLTARLDSDGNAMTRLPGDLQGAMSTPLLPGADGSLLTLDQRL